MSNFVTHGYDADNKLVHRQTHTCRAYAYRVFERLPATLDRYILNGDGKVIVQHRPPYVKKPKKQPLEAYRVALAFIIWYNEQEDQSAIDHLGWSDLSLTDQQKYLAEADKYAVIAKDNI